MGAPGSGAGSSPGDMVEQICTVDAVIVDERTCITVRGELDAMGAPDVQAAIASAAPGNVELDLRDVTFIDSSGLASVIEGHLRLTAQQRRLVLVDRSPVVQRLLDLSGVSNHIDLDP
ncbi:MAG TPA: STAS domain-containing protein [Acidimicrobiales bacterium]